MAVSFAQDIRPLFTDLDVAHMRHQLVKLDDFDYMRKPRHARRVLKASAAGRCRHAGAVSLSGRPRQSSCSEIGWTADTSPS
jgi:hypothetical protein